MTDPAAKVRPAKKPKPDRSEPSRLRLRVRRVVSAISIAMSVALVAGIGVGLVVGRPHMLAEASRLKESPVRVVIDWPRLAVQNTPSPIHGGYAHVSLTNSPGTWLDVGSQATLIRLAESKLTSDPFDAESIRQTQQAMMETGWFARPCSVTRTPEGVVVIRGDWREPVAAVRFGERDYLVSARSERLPPDYTPDASGLKVLIGPERDAPIIGEQWIGGDVMAGLALLNCLSRVPLPQRQGVLDQVYAIDISEYSSTKRLVIVTDTGSRILWGSEPGKFAPGQAPDQIKLDRLARMIRDHGRIDAARDFLDVSLAGVY